MTPAREDQQNLAYPIERYVPGRFAYLMERPVARELWEFLARKDSVAQMVASTDDSKPAIWPVLDELESRFGNFFTDKSVPDDDAQVLANNMIKQLMEMEGYEHAACGLCPMAGIFKSSGLYKKHR